MSGSELLYDAAHIAFLEEMWGEGYLSPGGAEEVAAILGGLDLSGVKALDIGCGTGGITGALVRDFGVRHVTGVDVEAPVCAAARNQIAKMGVADQVEIFQVEPGPLPVPSGSLGLVFSKDSIVHIAAKEVLAADVFRVLEPGGWFAASDWLISHDGEPSPEMTYYLACEDLNFGMASPKRYAAALKAAGFIEIRLVNRNPWYRIEARRELARLSGPERPKFETLLSKSAIAAQIKTWEAMLVVLDSGEHCPHHLRARKPLA